MVSFEKDPHSTKKPSDFGVYVIFPSKWREVNAIAELISARIVSFPIRYTRIYCLSGKPHIPDRRESDGNAAASADVSTPADPKSGPSAADSAVAAAADAAASATSAAAADASGERRGTAANAGASVATAGAEHGVRAAGRLRQHQRSYAHVGKYSVTSHAEYQSWFHSGDNGSKSDFHPRSPPGPAYVHTESSSPAEYPTTTATAEPKVKRSGRKVSSPRARRFRNWTLKTKRNPSVRSRTVIRLAQNRALFGPAVHFGVESGPGACSDDVDGARHNDDGDNFHPYGQTDDSAGESGPGPTARPSQAAAGTPQGHGQASSPHPRHRRIRHTGIGKMKKKGHCIDEKDKSDRRDWDNMESTSDSALSGPESLEESDASGENSVANAISRLDEDLKDLPTPNPLKWTVNDVCEYIKKLPGCDDYVEDFLIQEIDGQALLLLKADHLMSAMSMKLGPALKICAKIDTLRSIAEGVLGEQAPPAPSDESSEK
ncbi:unnamed protein product [Nesidiocoris tenuis]|uniref:SAM domain-containing protein n=1 Tax=Nesidiocoris tenuis TaxID=355587 RepID=A0A6H5GV97_9HEMI|nr:unnamed protein product [Nesidiocoris tenuis]